ncbi:MAG: 4'-phosphopantetheinyl transferase superfamily protein [Sphingobacteriaceae bacterium]|jgi:phosphopantetheinyl transferase|nr:MAG: 4'-phosphopantetheinyl transferase superfamily protein [Pedobacter sp.]
MAICFRKEIDQDTRLAIWKIEESVEVLRSQIQLRESEEKLLQSFLHKKRKLHWLSARVLLAAMLNTKEYIEYRVDEHGKPYLVDFPYFISISHSVAYAAVMISKTCPVGIDIEQMDPKIVQLAHKFLSPAELSFVDINNRKAHLYACWCIKEAVFKLNGKRKTSLRDIQLSPFSYQQSARAKVNLANRDSVSCFDAYFETFDGYMMGYVWA